MADFRFRALACGATAALLGTIGILACSSSEDGPTGGEAAVDPEPLFREVESELVTRCGGPNGSCHVSGTQAPRWLANPDPYVSARGYRGVLPLTRDASDSILLTQVAHAGPSLKSFPQLYDKVASWISAELPKPPLPATERFSVQEGFNVVELGTLGSGLAGARLTFLATQANNVLTMSALRVQAPQNANLTIKSPFFVVLPRSGKVSADPKSNGFEGDLTVEAGTTRDLFSGRMVILRWDTAGQLKVVFNEISSTPGQGAFQACTALDDWKTKAIPSMSTPVDIYADDEDGGIPTQVIGKSSCLGCHAKEPPADEAPSPAVQAMDLRGYDTDPAKACAQARFRIDFADKSKSSILLNPQGKGNPSHPMKSLGAGDPVIQGIDAWVQAEQR